MLSDVIFMALMIRKPLMKIDKFKRGDLVLVEDLSLFLNERRKKENKLLGTVLVCIKRKDVAPFYRVLLHGVSSRVYAYNKTEMKRVALPWEHNMEKP